MGRCWILASFPFRRIVLQVSRIGMRTSSVSMDPGPPALTISWQCSEKTIQKVYLISYRLFGEHVDGASDAKRALSVPEGVFNSNRSYFKRLTRRINLLVVRMVRAAFVLVNAKRARSIKACTVSRF